MSHALRRFLRGAMILLSWFVIPYSRLAILPIKQKKLPKIQNPVLQIPATKLAHMIRTREITSEEVIRAYIDRCKEVNPLINAIVDDRFEEALEEARSVDRLVASGEKTVEQLEAETPLLGIPVSVKESIAVKGLSHQSGRKLKKKNIAAEDAPCIRQVRKNGGIVLLVSNTPELCMCWETYNKVTGQTRNPYDLTRTPGGSSGGESSLISSGGSLLGLSSDIAGSARLPAMFTGIYGHKPSPYVVSPDGHIPKTTVPNWGNFFTIAPMARYASDLPLLLKCISDPEGTKINLNPDINVNDIKFYYMPNDGPSKTTRPLSSDIQKAVMDVATYFKATKVQIDELKWSLEMSMSAMLRIDNIESIYFDHGKADGPPICNLTTETLKYMLGLSNSTFHSVVVGHLQQSMKLFPESQHKKMSKMADQLKLKFQQILGTDGVLIYPTFPTSAHKHYQIYHKMVDTSYMMVFNTIGLPVTNCMVRLDKYSLPIGIQIVTNPGRDELALAVAKEIEARFGGWVNPSSLS